MARAVRDGQLHDVLGDGRNDGAAVLCPVMAAQFTVTVEELVTVMGVLFITEFQYLIIGTLIHNSCSTAIILVFLYLGDLIPILAGAEGEDNGAKAAVFIKLTSSCNDLAFAL